MSQALRVLLVEDSEDDAALVVRALQRAGHDVTVRRVETAAAMQEALAEPWDVVLADYSLPSFDAPSALRILRDSGRDVPFIIVSGAVGEEAAVAAMRAGAHDYVMKENLARLAPAIQRELGDAENRRARARAESERRALEDAARRAEKLAALGTLAAGLAHELNNPIGIISSRIELMLLEAESTGLPQEVRDDLGVLHRQAQRVARITQGLLSFARQPAGERTTVDLNHIVRETLLLAEKQIIRSGIGVATTLAPDLPEIVGDPGALQQVVLNLVTNAWEAVSPGGRITIETGVCPGDGRVGLIVEDTGRGIAPELLSRIFDPFFTTKDSGTGLGLAITDGIVREHGGTIDVESWRGKGTRFVVAFPPAPSDAGGSASRS
jgi:signal transduction histidine kinase